MRAKKPRAAKLLPKTLTAAELAKLARDMPCYGTQVTLITRLEHQNDIEAPISLKKDVVLPFNPMPGMHLVLADGTKYHCERVVYDMRDNTLTTITCRRTYDLDGWTVKMVKAGWERL